MNSKFFLLLLLFPSQCSNKLHYRHNYVTAIPSLLFLLLLLIVGLLIAGHDQQLGHQIYRTDPEGSFDAWTAVCIGEGSAAISLTLQSLEHELRDIPVARAWELLQTVIAKHFPETLAPFSTTTAAAATGEEDTTERTGPGAGAEVQTAIRNDASMWDLQVKRWHVFSLNAFIGIATHIHRALLLS